LSADAFLVATGADEKLSGLNRILWPLRGYSLTTSFSELRHSNPELPKAPINVGMVIKPYHLYLTRFGKDTIRATWFAEFDALGAPPREERWSELRALVKALLGIGFPADTTEWMGERPLTADDLPIISRGNYDNLYINQGHGLKGWKQCMGSGSLVADLIQGVTPPVPFDIAYLDVRRFTSWNR